MRVQGRAGKGLQLADLTIRHGTKPGVVHLRVPDDASVLEVKRALVRAVGRGSAAQVRLGTRVGNTFSILQDGAPLGARRELVVLGLDLQSGQRAAAEGGGGGSAPPRPAGGYAKVEVVVTDEAGGSELRLLLPEVATMGEVRAAAAARLGRSVADLGLLAERGCAPCGDAEALLGRWDLVLLEAAPAPAAAVAPRHWRRGAAELATLLGAMRTGATGAGAHAQALGRLLGGPPEASAYRMAAFSPAELAAELLRDLQAVRRGPPPSSRGLERLLSRLEAHVAAVAAGADAAFRRALDEHGIFRARPVGGAEAARGSEPPHAGALSSEQRLVLLVSFPLALYVRNNPHLYELIRRMRLMRSAVKSGASVCEVLDGEWPKATADRRPYSALVYAILAALQAMRSVAVASGENAEDGLSGLAPLDATGEASSGADPSSGPAQPAGPSPVSSPKAAAGAAADLMYRGIWVPEVIDEEAARYQWSFNSFSRSLEGVCHVLSFYAGAAGSEAAHTAALSCHVLLLVARRARAVAGRAEAEAGDWAFPVQFFGGVYGEMEQELLVPPFAAYAFEEGLELLSGAAPAERAARLTALEGRWGLALGGLLRGAPLLAELLEGRAEPLRHLPRAPRVTVRFVRRVDVAGPVRKLLDGSSESLLAFGS